MNTTSTLTHIMTNPHWKIIVMVLQLLTEEMELTMITNR